jgi:hypothetical protein
LATWRTILAWAQRKMEDIGNWGECRDDKRKALEEIVSDIERGAKAAFASRWVSKPATDLGDIDQSIQYAVDEEYERLCQHPKFHADGDARMPCCIRKQLFKEMIEQLPILPLVRKRLEHRGFED